MILQMLIVGFILGFSGALVPGPMLFATIESSLRRGARAGVEIVLGHALIEIIVALAMLVGFTIAVRETGISIISILGGIVLSLFGIRTILDSKGATLTAASGALTHTPVMAGIITSASNPYFWIWWLTVGAGGIAKGLQYSMMGAIAFVIGHWGSDFGWYTMVSASFGMGRVLFSDSVYRSVLVFCGIFMIVFGVWFITSTL